MATYVGQVQFSWLFTSEIPGVGKDQVNFTAILEQSCAAISG